MLDMTRNAFLRPLICSVWALCIPSFSVASTTPASLPPKVLAELQKAQVPPEAVSVVVLPLSEAGAKPKANAKTLSWQANQPMNPASLLKLVTTYAALDQLGPAWTWRTPVYLQGTVKAGVLEGDLLIKGTGDPKLVMERLWLLLRRVQQMGVREIRGDIVLDNSAYRLPEASPADFDGEPWRPANVLADALSLNYKSVVYTFTPEPNSGLARVTVDPPLAGVSQPSSVPLGSGPCDDWRAALKPQWQNPNHIKFSGGYPAACAEQRWPVAYADPDSYNARLLAALWRDMGGQLSGSVRSGVVSPQLKPSFEFTSPPLAEVVRDVNKFSNNLMAQQLFLSLPLALGAPVSTPELAQAQLHQWLQGLLGAEEMPGALASNGSGLSRDARLSARQLSLLLERAWASPVMSELMSSLPVAGLDGTLARGEKRFGAAQARAHLKTGSLRDALGFAGYVLSASGQRYVLVAIVNHAKAGASRSALDALVHWTAEESAKPAPTRKGRSPG